MRDRCPNSTTRKINRQALTIKTHDRTRLYELRLGGPDRRS
jgi:hypothetical protein